jgi:hypothetical protein
MKRLIQTLRPIALIGIGLLLALSSAAISQPSLAGSASVATVAPTATPQAVSEVGSTDWITLVTFLIVIIVIAPILARRKSWNN